MKYPCNTKTGNTKTALFIVLGTVAVWMLPVHANDDAPPIEVDPQPLAAALNSLSEQSGLQFAYVTTVASGIESPGTSGAASPADALDSMLAGTGLTYSYINDTTVAIAAVERPDEGAQPGKYRPASSLVLMAQNRASAERRQTSRERAATSNVEDDDNLRELEEIIVTGSQIRGAGAAGANVITLDREYIELSGLATTQEILQTLPQNFGGGANEVTQNVNVDFASANTAFSSSVNLRGLGTESTLSLINGRRSAAGGPSGNFVDLNSIPAAAVERVEVLADGASAIYGSDAIGGVVNVILRDNYEGAQTSLRYGPGTSDIDEIQFSQVFGKSWDTGNVLFTYEYYDRSELKSADRKYTRDSDLTSLGGTDSSTTSSNPGNVIAYFPAAGGVAFGQWAIPTGQDGTALTRTDLLDGVTNLQNIREGTTVLPTQERHTAALLFSQNLSSKVSLFADIRYSSREFENLNSLLGTTRFFVPSSNAFFVDLDPLGGATRLVMDYSDSADFGPSRSSGTVDTIGATLGATFSLSSSWELEVYGSHNSEDTASRRDRFVNSALRDLALADDNPATAFNPFGDGSNTNPATLAAIEGFLTSKGESELSVFDVRADGDLFDLAGGAVKLAIGAQFRDESLLSNTTTFLFTPAPVQSMDFELQRDVSAVFTELYLPLVTDQNSRPGIKRLAVSLAARYEDYSDFGDTLNPKIGVSWSPTDSLTVRSTAGTSFRAPLLRELDDSEQSAQVFTGVPDPEAPLGESTVIFLAGNSRNLVPEEGVTWTVGFDVTPVSLPGLTIGLTYFDTQIEDLIAVPTDSFTQPLLEPENFAPIISRVPDDITLEEVAAILGSPRCFGGCSAFSADEIGAIVDRRLNNLTESRVSGLDFNVGYSLDLNAGSIDLSLNASHLLEFGEQPFAGGPFEDQLDTFIKPNSLRLRGGISWSIGGLHAALMGNFISDYTSDRGEVCRTMEAGFCRISSWTTWDLNVGYDFSERYAGFLKGTRVSLNVRNVFDREPPFIDVSGVGVGFDPFNANPWGSHLTLLLTKEW